MDEATSCTFFSFFQVAKEVDAVADLFRNRMTAMSQLDKRDFFFFDDIWWFFFFESSIFLNPEFPESWTLNPESYMYLWAFSLLQIYCFMSI